MRSNVKSEKLSPSFGAPQVDRGGTWSRRSVWLSMLALAAAVTLTSHPPVEAAPTMPVPEARPLVRSFTPDIYRVAQADMAPRTGAEWATCYKVRKRLWLDDEGWIIRRVSVCRQ